MSSSFFGTTNTHYYYITVLSVVDYATVNECNHYLHRLQSML